jgi:predicted nucleotidyltransferase
MKGKFINPWSSQRLASCRFRGEAGRESDVDLLIEVDPGAGFGLSDLLDLQEELGGLLDRRINFAFGSEMRPWLRAWIEDDRIGIF